MATSFTFSTAQHGMTKLLVSGYGFVKQKGNNHRIWECDRRKVKKCLVTATLRDDHKLMLHGGKHTHEPPYSLRGYYDTRSVAVTDFSIKTTQRGQPRLVYSGYGFVKALKDNFRYWVCDKKKQKKCPVTGIMNNKTLFLKVKSHNHLPPYLNDFDFMSQQYEEILPF